MTKRQIKKRGEWENVFHKCHEAGVKEFGGLWLSANANSINLASQFDINHSLTQNKAFMSRIILCTLRTARPQ